MSDIVERLRHVAQEFERTRPFDRALAGTMSEAADEIERLRQDNHSLWGSLRNRMAADAARTLPR